MNDFDYEVLQRKRLAQQSSHKKRGSKSKKCPMSTDHMTKRQWIERCGEIVTYQLGKPMSWEDFKRIPAGLQKEYLLDLIHKYHTTASDLAKMFGITSNTVTKFCGNQEIGIEFSRGKRMPKDCRAEFEKFLYGDNMKSQEQGSSSAHITQELRVDGTASNMSMTEFSLCFEGTIVPEMITNSIIAMLRPNSNVKLEVKCSVLGNIG